jgi:hypothetical protein
MAKKKKTKPRAKVRRSPRARRRATVVKLVEGIEGEDAGHVERLRLAAQAMAQLLAEGNLERRDKWKSRIKTALAPTMEELLTTGSRAEKLQAGHLAARLIDPSGEHLFDAKRAEYGSTIIESLSSVDLGKLQAQVDTGGDEITSERWLRVLADMQPVFKEAVDRAVAEALKAAKT